MTTSVKTQLGTSIGEAVFSEVVSKSSRYYYYVGKNYPYNVLDTTEEPANNLSYEYKTRSDIISYKEIKASDVCFVTARYDWKPDVVYDTYDDFYSINNLAYSGASSLEEAKFYVVTDSYNLYKCISNNDNSKSTVKPIFTDSEQFTTSDGYVWKFMLNIPIGLRNKFLYGNYVPISNSIKNSFYSSGAINNISIDNHGTGYTVPLTTLTISGDGYLEENPYIITALNVTNAGSGYSTTPSVTFSAPVAISGSEIQAIGSVTISGGSVNSSSVSNVGYGYDYSVSVIIEPPFAGDIFAVSTTLVEDSYVYYNFNYYKVIGNGVCGIVPPIHITGSVASGSVSLEFVGRQAQATVNITKTEALITPVISGGQVTNVVINDAGIGYTWAIVTVVGDGVGAEFTVDLTSGNLNTLQSTVELLATDGSIDYIKIENKGQGYSNAVVNISGDGTGATATATIINGSIAKINMLSRGTGYRYALATISGDGTGAILRVILPPIGGHGKNAINELFCNKLMMHSSFSDSKISGVIITNDYRQVGIIKNPNKYLSNYKFTSDNGHASYATAFTSPTELAKISDFLVDDIVTASGGKVFNVVSTSADKIIFNSAKNSVLVSGETLTNTRNSVTITPTSVGSPTVDKYSGDLIYIDNRAAFITTENQSVSLRTIIEY